MSESFIYKDPLMRYITIILVVLLLLAIGIFSIQNLASVDVSFFFWSSSTPKTFLLLGTYVLGMLTGWGLIELIKMGFRKRS